MRIGIISNSDCFIPLAGALVAQQQQVYLFYSASADVHVNQKVSHLLNQLHIAHVEQEGKDVNLYNWLVKGKFDACFIVGYPKLIVLNKLKTSITPIFNIHFGSLPAYKGPTPIFWQLKHGDKKIGLTIHRLSKRFDEGVIVWHKEIDNETHFSYKYVEQLFSQLCVEGVFFILQLIMLNLPILEIPRGDVESVYYSKPKMEDVLICWESMTAEEICNLIGACNSWNKGALTSINGTEVKIMDARVVNERTDLPTGTILSIEESLYIACCNSTIIRISMLFIYDSFVPSYHLKKYGIREQQRFESSFAKANTV